MPQRQSVQYVTNDSSKSLILEPSSLTRTDALFCLALLAATALWIAANFHASFVPIEDAAMLLRYANNLAHGFGIRWNIHQQPVDGATDFLYTVAIGSLARLLHIGVIPACRILNLTAHILSVVLVYLGGRLLGGNRWLAAGIATYLMVGPAMAYTMGCFGAPFFAFFLMGCWLAGLNYALRTPTWSAALAMALLGLLAGLDRPEGVLISGIFALAILYLIPRGARRAPVVISYLLVFGILGGAYFFWHWHYFGYPLPNPYYIKGNGHLYPRSVTQAATNVCNLLGPVLPLFPLGWILPRTRRLANALAGVIVAFILMWILLNNWNNAYMRFQYAIIPAVLMTLPGLAMGGASLFVRQREAFARQHEALSHRIVIAAVSLLYLFSAALYLRREFPPVANTSVGMRDFAQRLLPFANKGYTIVVTEAGTLPFYSEWQTIDGLGLNDRTMAHNGHKLTTEYLDAFRPEVMMAHIDNVAPAPIYRNELYGDDPSDGSSWGNMGFINAYARDHHYTLAAVWGSDPCNVHVYWVRPGFPDYDQILALIRQHPYVFLDDGRVSTDFRDQMQNLRDCEHP